MKLQRGATFIDISLIDVQIEERQRQLGREAESRKLKDLEELEKSITRIGLLNPIIIEPRPDAPGRFWLKAGERRLTACRNLKLTEILARKAQDLSPAEAQIIELEENVKRKDLEWQDIVRSVDRIHSLYRELDPDWTMGETANHIGMNLSTVSLYLSVAVEMKEQRVRDAGTVREAYNMLQRRSQRQAGLALQELLETPDVVEVPAESLTEEEKKEVETLKELGEPIPQHLTQKILKPAVPQLTPKAAPEAIIQASFLDWAKTYSGKKFNLVHCDFPYGVELFSGPQGRGAEASSAGRVGYKDSADIYWTLVETFCQNLDRFMSVSSHLMFWLSAEQSIVQKTLETFGRLAPSLKFHKFPLIWLKSDNAGIASDPRHGPRHVYELCLLASRGSRQIVRVKADAYSAPTDKKLHPSTKPEPMLRHFMEMLVDETTSLLDPTCGSGASLRAAESLGATSVLGLEIDPQYLHPARLALKQARQKRLAERADL